MKRTAVAAVIAAVLALGQAVAQEPSPALTPAVEKLPAITLRARIVLPGVYGRMDHYGWDSKRGRLIVDALGNDTVEIIDSWKRVHTITGFDHPQQSVYIPDLDEIAVADQGGKVRFFDAETYKLVRTVDFGADADADNMRYDPAAKRLYVDYGEDEAAAIAVVDPASGRRLTEYKVGSHPESFQLERKGSRIYVNLPDQESFGVIDRKTGAITKWKIPGNTNAHPLAFDEADHRLFTAAFQPGRFTAVDSDTGKVVAEMPCVPGVDDIWYDAGRKRIYAPGSGAISIFQQVTPDKYVETARVPVGEGTGSTSLYLKTRTTEGIYMSDPNMLAAGGSEVLLLIVNGGYADSY